MKRQALIRHLEGHGCYLLREGGNHSIYVNPANNQTSAVPRHREINDFLARKQDLPRLGRSRTLNGRARL